MKKEFTFAGIKFPHVIYQIPKDLRKKRELRKHCGPYYTSTQPITGGPHPGGMGYLNSDFEPSPRWTWADEVEGVRIEHTGWYTDAHGVAETLRGIVFHLPHGRHLAGWSMGEGMLLSYDGELYNDAADAARAADRLAELAAERERESQEAEEERRREEEAEEERLLEAEGHDEEETTY